MDDSSPMVECSACHNWMHTCCIGLSDATFRAVDGYQCPSCVDVDVGRIVREMLVRPRAGVRPVAIGGASPGADMVQRRASYAAKPPRSMPPRPLDMLADKGDSGDPDD
eukprot:CAMPEP_0185171148 /NCGR_PEP_ID=MMETSP1139-20130426/19783_1 /TAXON_ID=298111 /ORGANISM="Pavlova sp., Strain CCMP459" /LENGTH=108 /DNA_ID=CAMNT_0027736751 /DNA_START=1 /DNA_END=324 /DNA_ORIENTATION=-